MRSAREFKEAFEEMDSVSLFSSSFMYESSCSFVLFLDPESDGGTIAKEREKKKKEYRTGNRAGIEW